MAPETSSRNHFVGESRAEGELGLADAQREARIEQIKATYGVDTAEAVRLYHAGVNEGMENEGVRSNKDLTSISPTGGNSVIVTSEYGKRLHPLQKIFKNHNGIDLRNELGGGVYAMEGGRIITIGAAQDGNNRIHIRGDRSGYIG